jgi:hypothetical protein
VVEWEKWKGVGSEEVEGGFSVLSVGGSPTSEMHSFFC